MSSKRQRYTLGHGVYDGQITLDNGEVIRVEYRSEVQTHGVSTLPHLQDAIEYIAARICEEETSYTHILVRSIFHSTTWQHGQRVMDKDGAHLTFTASRPYNGVTVRQDMRVGHAYISGLDLRRTPDHWYDTVELSYVRWE